ncbi:MAG: hypothetical protein V1726_03550 [Methanobacteriota archaeon]
MDTSAVSAVISVILSIALIFSVVTGILFWGLPQIERTKAETSVAAMFNQMFMAADSVEDMIQDANQSTRQFEFILQEGSFSVDSIGDRFVVLYSFDSNYNFTVSDIGDPDRKFSVSMISYPPGFMLDKLVVFRFINQPSVSTFRQPNVDQVMDGSNIQFTWGTAGYVSFSYKLENFNPHWSSWIMTDKATYRDLPDGSYIFRRQQKDTSLIISEVEPIPFSVVEGYIIPPEKVNPINIGSDIYVIPCSNPINCTHRIDLYDAGSGPSPYLFGRIFVFDLGYLDCSFPTSSGTYGIIMENNAILSMVPEGHSLKREPIFSFKDNQFSCRIIQYKNSGFSVGGNSYGKFSLGFTLEENYVRELYTNITNTKIQVYGLYNDIWIDYFIHTYGFSQVVDSPPTLLCPQSGSTMNKLVLTQSLFSIS